MRNRTGDLNKKRLQFPSSLEDNYQYAKYADFDDRTQEFITTQINLFIASITMDPQIPQTYKEALAQPNLDKWIQAMQDEYQSLV